MLPLFHALGVHAMFRFALGSSLVRLATLPGRVAASGPTERTSERLKPTTDLPAADGPLMRPRCYLDRLIAQTRAYPPISLTVSPALALTGLSITHIYYTYQIGRPRERGRNTLYLVVSGYQGGIREASGEYQAATTGG